MSYPNNHRPLVTAESSKAAIARFGAHTGSYRIAAMVGFTIAAISLVKLYFDIPGNTRDSRFDVVGLAMYDAFVLLLLIPGVALSNHRLADLARDRSLAQTRTRIDVRTLLRLLLGCAFLRGAVTFGTATTLVIAGALAMSFLPRTEYYRAGYIIEPPAPSLTFEHAAIVAEAPGVLSLVTFLPAPLFLAFLTLWTAFWGGMLGTFAATMVLTLPWPRIALFFPFVWGFVSVYFLGNVAFWGDGLDFSLVIFPLNTSPQNWLIGSPLIATTLFFLPAIIGVIQMARRPESLASLT